MDNLIQKHRAFVAGQIEKSFDSEIEKAYAVGDTKDFNGRTYYVHALNAKGQPLWRLKEKKGNKPSAVDIINKIPEKEFKSITKTLEKVNPDSDDAPKYLEEEAMSDEELANFHACAKHFKNNDRINKTTQEWCKKWEQLAQEEIDFRKEQKQKKSGSKSDQRDKIAKNTGLKKYYDEDSNETWYEGKVSGKRVRILQETVGKTDWWNVEIDGKFIKNSDGNAMTFQTPKEALDEIEETQSRNKKADSKQDKIAQNAGFKDYEEMRGYQNYVTAKNLLKKRSMQASTKAAHRNELEKQIIDYEKDHKDVIDRIKNKKK